MVGGQHEQDRIIARPLRPQRGSGERGCGIPGQRLEQHGRIGHRNVIELIAHDEAVLFVTHHDRRSEPGVTAGRDSFEGQRAHPLRRLLEQRALTEGAQQLLGIPLARQGPEPGTGSSREDHRNNEHSFQSSFPFVRAPRRPVAARLLYRTSAAR